MNRNEKLPMATREVMESHNANTNKIEMALIEIANNLKLLALSNICSTEEERENLKARLWE